MRAAARTDEEEQVTIALLQSHIHDLQNEVHDLQDKTDRTDDDLQQQKESNVTNNQVLQKDIRDRNEKMQRELDKTKAELKSDMADLKQQLLNLASNTTASSPTAAQPNNVSPSARPSPLRAAPSFFFQRKDATHDALPPNTYTMMMTLLRELDERSADLKTTTRSSQAAAAAAKPDNETDDATQDDLPHDTYTLMMMSNPLSKAWLLGIFTFAFQIVLIAMIFSNQLKQSRSSSPFNVPFKVDPEVRVGQLFTIFFALATQSDITDAVRFIIMFWSDPHWDRTILGREEGAPPPTTNEWRVHIFVPNFIKFVQGSMVMIITLVVIVQSDNIIDLLTNFAALMFLLTMDNIFFSLAGRGYLGSELQRKANDAKGAKIKSEVSTASDSNNEDHNDNGYLIRPVIIGSIAALMVGIWLKVVSNQVNGTYFDQRYPGCNKTLDAFQLAEKHFGDGVCYGGTLNTLGCEFEGGDCINFNLAFPLCKGDNRTDVQSRVGNGKCEKEFMSSDCDYDGGDCCPYEIINDPSFGDGTCDKKANFEECGYDNGDCVDYNRDYSGCPLDVVFGNALFGDGQWCNGGIASTKNCSYDNGDCDEFRISYPRCPLDDLSRVEGADDVVIGDGICDSGIYNLAECGYEFGDCKWGQVGKHISITEDFVDGELYFSKALSLDGMTMALGFPLTNNDGSIPYSLYSPGLVKVWRYSSIRKMWSQLGNDIVGQREGYWATIGIGRWMSLSADGNRLMISSPSGIRIYDFNAASDDWIQMGQPFTSSMAYSLGVMTSDGLKVAFFNSWHEIRVFDVDESSDFDVIMPDFELDWFRTQLTFNTNDGSRLLLSVVNVTKVYEYDPDNTPKSWTQIGQRIKNPSSSSYSSAISADGNRIAVSSNATSTNAPGQVDVYDYDAVGNAWIPVGDPIKSSSSSNGDGFGYDIKISSDGNLLVIASNGPECQPFSNQFDIDKCTSGSIEVYNFHPKSNRFKKAPPNNASPFKADGNVLNLANLVSSRAIFGLHFSMDDDGSVLSISGYNVDDESAFVEVHDLNELFHTKCVVNYPRFIGDGECEDYPPYNMEECGIDGGDCKRNPVDGWPECFVHYTGRIGDGRCNDEPPYNSEECGFDGGDCERKPVEGWPDCFVRDTDRIGNGECDDWPPYNSEECGFDGGDCERKPVKRWPGCFVYYTDWIGNGLCEDWPPYNSKECGIDGDECERKPVNGWPECFVHYTDWIGDGECNDYPPYNTEECGFDGGDCLY